jgi:hypothetical protein
MEIDETRGDDTPGSLDLVLPGLGDLPDDGDDPLVDCDVSPEGLSAGPIDDKATPDHKIMHGVLLNGCGLDCGLGKGTDISYARA